MWIREPVNSIREWRLRSAEWRRSREGQLVLGTLCRCSSCEGK